MRLLTRLAAVGLLAASWDRYEERALVGVFGGSQPDAGYRLEVIAVRSTHDGGTLRVEAGLVRGSEPAIQVISVPWLQLSVEADAVRGVDTCILDGGEDVGHGFLVSHCSP